ncbi:MAG: hypothetical protein ACKO23_15620, partial [Gemmataceae bacterium]
MIAYHEKLLAGQAEVIEPTVELPAGLVSRLHKTQSVLKLLEQDRQRSLPSRPTPEQVSSTAPAAPLIPARGEAFGRFRILGEIGSGGHGIVFLAWDPHLGREVALKLPRPEVLLNPGFRKRFLHEAHLVAGLNHPG